MGYLTCLAKLSLATRVDLTNGVVICPAHKLDLLGLAVGIIGRVAHPFASVFLSHYETVGAPSLRFVQGRVRCCGYHGLSCLPACIASTALITCTLSPTRVTDGCRSSLRLERATDSSPSSSLRRSQRDAVKVPLRGRGLRRHARTHSSFAQRAGSGQPFDGHASAQTAHGPCPSAQTTAPQCRTTPALWRSAAPGILASPLLRIQCVE